MPEGPEKSDKVPKKPLTPARQAELDAGFPLSSDDETTTSTSNEGSQVNLDSVQDDTASPANRVPSGSIVFHMAPLSPQGEIMHPAGSGSPAASRSPAASGSPGSASGSAAPSAPSTPSASYEPSDACGSLDTPRRRVVAEIGLPRLDFLAGLVANPGPPAPFYYAESDVPRTPRARGRLLRMEAEAAAALVNPYPPGPLYTVGRPIPPSPPLGLPRVDAEGNAFQPFPPLPPYSPPRPIPTVSLARRSPEETPRRSTRSVARRSILALPRRPSIVRFASTAAPASPPMSVQDQILNAILQAPPQRLNQQEALLAEVQPPAEPVNQAAGGAGAMPSLQQLRENEARLMNIEDLVGNIVNQGAAIADIANILSSSSSDDE